MPRWAVFVVLLAGCSWVDAPGNLPLRLLVEGDQATIDAGHAVNYNGCWPGEGCTMYLAGHRTTHGSVFAAVADLQPGDPVRVGHDGEVHEYVVTRHVLVDQHSQINDVLYGDLVLQTSASNGKVHLVYCEGV